VQVLKVAVELDQRGGCSCWWRRYGRDVSEVNKLPVTILQTESDLSHESAVPGRNITVVFKDEHVLDASGEGILENAKVAHETTAGAERWEAGEVGGPSRGVEFDAALLPLKAECLKLSSDFVVTVSSDREIDHPDEVEAFG
jgi:hypothetical protein